LMAAPKTVAFHAVFYSKRTSEDGSAKLTLSIPTRHREEVGVVESWYKKHLVVTVSVDDPTSEEQGGAG